MNWLSCKNPYTKARKKAYLFHAFLLLLVLFLQGTSYSQDSTQVVSAPSAPIVIETDVQSIDSAKMAQLYKRFDPQKALLYAAVLPGAGQVYNKKYWKVPIVYGGFFFLGYFINSYNDSYLFYKNELFLELNAPGSSTSGLQESTLRTYTDQYRRERDFFIVLTGIWYLLQIIDAHVDAHLKEFELNPNLNVRIEPSFKQDMLLGRQSGFSVSLRF